MTIKAEPVLLEMLANPAYSGPNNSCKPVLDKLFSFTGYEELFDNEYGLAILKWLGTYLIPNTPLTLPCPPDLDLLKILPNIFNWLPSKTLLLFLQEAKALLGKTLTNVRAAAPERSDWLGELERRYAMLDGLIECAAYNAKVEGDEITSWGKDSERIFCPICNKRFASHYCSHYVGSKIDGYMFSWINESPHFFDEVNQLNRTINRSKTQDVIFKVLLSEAPANIGELFQEVRENGSSYWTYRDGIQVVDSYTNGCGSSSSINLYFHDNPTELVFSVRTETQQALDWLEAFHPEILVKREHYVDYYEDNYRGGYEGYDSFEDIEEDYVEEELLNN